MTSIYNINKGINKPIEFRGLKAQYIGYLCAVIVALLFVFALMYICGIPAIVCVFTIAIGGAISVLRIYRLCLKYGQYGMMKAIAKKYIPKVLKCNSRKIFIDLKNL